MQISLNIKNILFHISIFLGSALILFSLALLLKTIIKTETPMPISPLIKILNKNDEVEELPLEKFLVGVLAAEMPASFEHEALKAQAIAARTYIINCFDAPTGSGHRHENAVVCCNSAHCQAFFDIEEMQMQWGKNFDEYYRKINKAVSTTAGKIILYHGKIINALYFSTCGGATTSAKDYWGNEVAYLQSVACGFDEDSPRYSNLQSFSLTAAAKNLGCSKNVLEQRIKDLPPKTVREKLGLFSAKFSYQLNNKEISFQSKGSGHGVGLCQYGANGMAKQGYTAEEIIKHYYSDVEIKQAYEK